ncbi:MAG: hypothetical protein DSZ24_06365 [Thermodesulfatator sp.]|nr:MAG: hypothetical protein DSZ24_06365 [Thermodesulfatator sp.]
MAEEERSPEERPEAPEGEELAVSSPAETPVEGEEVLSAEETGEESPEKLMQALEREEEPEEGVPEEEGPAESEARPSWWGTLFLLAGIFLCLGGISAAGLTLWKLAHGPVRVSSAPPERASVSKSVSSSTLPVPLVKTEFSLVLKHFLIPLETEGGAPVFIKASVVLYFEDQREVQRAKRIERVLRGLIYDTFRNIPFYYWRSPEGVTKIREALLRVFRARAPEGLVPKEIDVRGYILK